jgi:hypothetical protein
MPTTILARTPLIIDPGPRTQTTAQSHMSGAREMSAGEHPVQRSRRKWSASALGLGPRHCPVRTSDLEVLLAADARHQRTRRVDDALEIERDKSRGADVR